MPKISTTNEQNDLRKKLTGALSMLCSLPDQMTGYIDITYFKKEAFSKVAEAKKAIEEISFPDFGCPVRTEEKIANAQRAMKAVNVSIQMLAQLISTTENTIHIRENKIKNDIQKILRKRNEDKSSEWIHILHLSDLHFGYYYHSSANTAEQDMDDYFEVVKDALFDFFRKYVRTNGRIHIIAITGDISYQNDPNGYRDFGDWLKELCQEDVLDIDIRKNVIMCVGNHDSSYESRDDFGILSNEEADRKHRPEQRVDSVLTKDHIAERQEQFSYFSNLCLHLGMENLTNFRTPLHKPPLHYLFGRREIEGINFIVLNTAWNSFPQKTKDGKDNGYNHGNLYLGRRLIRPILSKQKTNEITITLFHHPLSWLHETESRSYGNDQELPVVKSIREHSDIILNGHVHGRIDPPDVLANKTLVFSGGTLNTNDSASFQFEILSINTTTHYCTQKIVTYNRQECNGKGKGWTIENDDHLTPYYFGTYKSARELVAKVTLSEITAEEAFDNASEEVQKGFEEIYSKTKLHEISNLVNSDSYSENSQS